MPGRRVQAAVAAAAIMLPLYAAVPAAAATPARVPAALPSDCGVEATGISTEVPWEQEQTRYRDIWRMFHNQGQGITVAVIDTGLQLDPAQGVPDYPAHPQLTGINVTGGRDFTGNQEGADWDNDCDGHGTGVASVIAAQPCIGCTDQGGDSAKIPFTGVAPQVTLMPLRITNKRDERFSNDALAEAIQYAVDNDVDIINTSLETTQDWPKTRAAVEAAYQKDIVIVAAAGNNGAQDAYPAKYAGQFPNVISVGAIDEFGALMENSGSASYTTLVAPGKGVHTAQSAFGHKSETGTSFAAPFVSGVVALMMVHFEDITAPQVRRRLELTAIKPGRDVRDAEFGYGMVDPIAALTSVIPDNVRVRPTLPEGEMIPAIPKPVPPDNTTRDRALLAFGIAAGLALATLAIASVYRRGKARNWRPGVPQRTA